MLEMSREDAVRAKVMTREELSDFNRRKEAEAIAEEIGASMCAYIADGALYV